jgi:hypothetical protein
MTELTIAQKIKQRVRIKTNVLDGEIDDLIEEAKADLTLSGVLEEKIVDTDPLILRAVSTYCKIYYEGDNVKAERLQKSYDSLKTHLSMSVDYTVADDEDGED